MKLLDSRLILILFLGMCASNAYAVWYQVELIIFEHLSPETDGEFWYSSPGLTSIEDSVILRHPDLIKQLEAQLEDQDSGPDIVLFPTLEGTVNDASGDEDGESSDVELIPYSLLPEENLRLEGIYRVLSLSSDYNPIYHITWQQEGLDIDETKPVHIQVEDPSELYELTVPATLLMDPMPAEFYEPIKLLIDGTIRIRSTLYLHVDMDLVMFKPPPVKQDEMDEEIFFDVDDFMDPTNYEEDNNPGLIVSEIISDFELQYQQDGSEEIDINVNNPVEYVRLVESRRIRLNELHYFDHPLFGAIIQVSRYGEEAQEF